VLHVSSRARLVASVVAVVVLGVIFGAFVVDGLKAPAEAPPAGLAAPAGACGANPTRAAADARAAGGTAADPVTAAELVYAAPFGGAPRDTVSWRLVRRSGTVVYVVADSPAAPPAGAVFREDEMRFMTTSRGPSKIGQLATAC